MKRTQIAPDFAQESARKRRAEKRSEDFLFGWVALMIVLAIVFCSVGGR